MTILFPAIFFVTSAVYVYWLLGFFFGLFRVDGKKTSGTRERVSVIIAARNEEDTISGCLQAVLRQDYDPVLVEILVVDDGSTDRTAVLVEEMARDCERLRLIRMERGRGKKAALTAGIGQATGTVLLFTDADCEVPVGWITGMTAHFTPSTGVVAGSTFFRPEDERSLFTRVQALDVIALISAGAGSIGAGRPVICNGSNLAYRKRVFAEVDGFNGINQVISGDDDMFIQKVRLRTDWEVTFCADPATYVRTRPAPGPATFFRQRIRWSSTGAHYPDRPFRIFLMITYIHYVLALAAVPLCVVVPSLRPFLLFLLCSKLGLELLILVKGCRLFGRTDLLPAAPLLAVCHMPYILAASTVGLFCTTKWT